MNYRDLLIDIANQFGLTAVKCWDDDMDIILPDNKSPLDLLVELEKYGFRYNVLVDDLGVKSLHIHAPHRKERDRGDRGWDWEVDDTSELAGRFGQKYAFDRDTNEKEKTN